MFRQLPFNPAIFNHATSFFTYEIRRVYFLCALFGYAFVYVVVYKSKKSNKREKKQLSEVAPIREGDEIKCAKSKPKKEKVNEKSITVV